MQRNQTAHSKPLSRRQMRGFSIWFLSLSLLLGGLLMLALRIMPIYAEYLTVRDVIVRAAAQHDSETQPLADLRVRIAKLLKANQVDDTSIDEIEIYRDRGFIVVDANYGKRFPLFWILDGVMKFDDLVIKTKSKGRT
jgi:cell division protein FtsL